MMGDFEYLTAMYSIILPIAYDFEPELVLISSGFDACRYDPLGNYCINPQTYGHFTHALQALAGGKVVMALEGGYNLESIADASSYCVSALLGDPLELLEIEPLKASAAATLQEVVDYHASNWPSLMFGADLPQNTI